MTGLEHRSGPDPRRTIHPGGAWRASSAAPAPVTLPRLRDQASTRRADLIYGAWRRPTRPAAGLRAALVVPLRDDRHLRPERAVRDVQLRPGWPQGHLECHREREVPTGRTDPGQPDGAALRGAVRAARAAAEVQQRGQI